MNPQELIAKGFSPEVAIFLTSMLPIVELRGALPLAINILNIPWQKAFFIAVFGNLLPVPFILLLLNPIFQLLQRVKIFASFFNWLFKRTRKKGKVVERYKEMGLMLFVAIPLPATGAWTGSLLAVLLGLDFKTSLLFIILGVLIAGVIVTSLCLLGYLGAIIAGLALLIFIIWRVWRL